MPITFECPRGHRLRVPDRHAGKKIRCPKCQAVTQVPQVMHEFEDIDPYDDYGDDFGDEYAPPMPRRKSKAKATPKRKKSSSSGHKNPYAHRELLSERTASRGRLPQGEYGGIGRLAYFGGGLLLGMFTQFMMWGLLQNGQPDPAMLFMILGIQLVGNMVLVGVRCVNLGMHPLWALGMLVPCLNIFIGLRCLACPEGYADHGELDLPGKIIAGIILALFVLLIVGVVLNVLVARP